MYIAFVRLTVNRQFGSLKAVDMATIIWFQSTVTGLDGTGRTEAPGGTWEDSENFAN